MSLQESCFAIEFGDCDESLHPRCEGVECKTVLVVSGFGAQQQAEEYAQDILYDRHTVANVLARPGEGLTAASLMTNDRDPATVILRDYNVADTPTPRAGRSTLYVAGGHDEFSLIEPD